MKHTFGQHILIPIEHSVNNEAIGSTSTLVTVCQACGFVASNEPYGWWEEKSLPDCPGQSEQPIPTKSDILLHYKQNYYKKNKDTLDKFNSWLGYDQHKGKERSEGIPDYAYTKKVEWDEQY